MSNSPSLINDCFLHDKDRLQHQDALDLLAERLTCVAGTENVPLSASLNRVLAETITAPHPVPLHTNSAVDGYAFLHTDLGNKPLPVSMSVAAGDLDPGVLPKGTAARIFTGAPMPPGADTVAMQEDCEGGESEVLLPQGLKPGANCRKAGEDLKPGEIITNNGQRITAGGLAALTSIGKIDVPVYKKLSVTLISNGNELRRPGDDQGPLKPGEVWDANAALLSSLLEKLPVSVIDGGIVRDNASRAREAVEAAAQTSDIIITTGGASRGQEDHMLTTIDQLGNRHLWQLAVKPGRPMMFGQIPRPSRSNDCIFLGLPGNPVAAMVCFLLYVRPAILALCGGIPDKPQGFDIPAGFSISNKKPDRREFLRGIIKTVNGKTVVDKYPRDGSGLISSLREADGLVEIPEPVTNIETGSLVRFIPFSSFG